MKSPKIIPLTLRPPSVWDTPLIKENRSIFIWSVIMSHRLRCHSHTPGWETPSISMINDCTINPENCNHSSCPLHLALHLYLACSCLWVGCPYSWWDGCLGWSVGPHGPPNRRFFEAHMNFCPSNVSQSFSIYHYQILDVLGANMLAS